MWSGGVSHVVHRWPFLLCSYPCVYSVHVHVLMYISTAYIRVAMVTQLNYSPKNSRSLFLCSNYHFHYVIYMYMCTIKMSHVILWQVCRRVDVTGTNRMVIHGVSH